MSSPITTTTTTTTPGSSSSSSSTFQQETPITRTPVLPPYGTLDVRSTVKNSRASQLRGTYAFHFILLILIFALTVAAGSIYGNQVQSSPPPGVITPEVTYAGVSAALSFIFIFVSIAYINTRVELEGWAKGLVAAIVLIVDLIILVLTSLGAAGLQNIYGTSKSTPAINNVYGLFVAAAVFAAVDFFTVIALTAGLSGSGGIELL